MQAKSLFVLSALVLAAGSVLADTTPNSNQPLTRAEVRQSVVDARANGELRPVGEAGDEVWTPAEAPRSTLTRAEVVQQIVAARAAGELSPVGEQGDAFFSAGVQPSGPGKSRAQVVAETRQARDAGLLEPAGQGEVGDYDEARIASQHQYAIAHEHHAAAPAASGAATNQ